MLIKNKFINKSKFIRRDHSSIISINLENVAEISGTHYSTVSSEVNTGEVPG